METSTYTSAELASFAIMICLLVLALFVGRTYFNKITYDGVRQDCHSATQTPRGRIALVLVGQTPSPTVVKYRLRSWLSNSRWAASVVCFAPFHTSLENHPFSVGIWPLRLLSSSTCSVAVMIPWDIDLGVSWDQHLHDILPISSNTCYSLGVLGCERLYYHNKTFRDCLPTPRLVIPSHNRSLLIPDYRFVVARPSVIANLAEYWFHSFFFGALVYPYRTSFLKLPADAPCPVFDPLSESGIQDTVSLTDKDFHTLLSLGIADETSKQKPALHYDVWKYLMHRPPIYIQISTPSALL